MNYLITPSLLNAWKYLFTDNGKIEDFIKVLNREPTEPNDNTKRGDRFEQWAMKNYLPTKNGAYQVKVSQRQTINGVDYVLYGRLDCLKAGKIYDYKCPARYEVGDFFGNYQTPFYLALVPEADSITYVIGTEKSDIEMPYNLYTEKYSRAESPDLKQIITEFEMWLKQKQLWNTYTNKWQSKED